MGFDAATDGLVDAVRSVVGANVNAALQAKYDRRPIPTTYGYPVPLEQLVNVQLPALSVYRVSTALTSVGRRDDMRRVVMALDYFAAPVPYENLDTEWPVLSEVWEQAITAVCNDSFSACAEVPDKSPANPLGTAGVVDLIEGQVQAVFSFAEGGQGAYPFFAGRMTFDVEPERAASTAPLFQQLVNSLRLFDASGAVVTDCDPIVQDQILNTAWDTGFTLGFGPPET